MSMTPERIEDIKPYFTDEQLNELSREYRTMPTDGEGYVVEPEYEGMAARGNIVKLVFDVKTARAALEESQQQIKNLKEDKRKIFAVHDEQCARSSEYYNELIFVKGKLVEAQQTIARQQQSWQALKDTVSTNATGGCGEDINDYDIMLNTMNDLEGTSWHLYV